MQSLQRIISLISSGTEILYGLGLEDFVLAVSHECDFPPAARSKPRATWSNINSDAASLAIDRQVRGQVARGTPLYELDVSLLKELAPQLLVTQAQCDVCAVRYDDVLAQVRSQPELAATQVLALNPQSLSDVLDDVRRVASATGQAQRGQAFIAALSARIETVKIAMRELPGDRRPRVVCLEWLDPLMLAANWTPELVQLAGGESGLASAGRHSVYGNWTEVLAYAPEVIIAMPCGFGLERTLSEAAVLPTWPGWNKLPAVRSGRVFAVDGNAYFNRSGPRLVDSLEVLAHLLHPEMFAPPLSEPARALAWQRFTHV